MTNHQLWSRYCDYLYRDLSIGFSLDISRVRFADDFFQEMEEPIQRAFESMHQLERGAVANPDEGRQVGHYWLRNPDLAPEPSLASAIREAIDAVTQFARSVHDGTITGSGGAFQHVLHIGIGGSALGPQLVADALGGLGSADRMSMHFLDNTDPDGIDRVLARLAADLGRTLTVVVSKSGGTPETRNGMLEAQTAYRRAGLDFAPHAVAVTGEGSALDQTAQQENWLRRFPMWSWVGGRTSVTSAVGLLPAALQGIDIDQFLQGAADMDQRTRTRETRNNPAALLALMWYATGAGRGAKDMVVLPYKDRLALFSRYLQQLIMESLGKERDRKGNVVHQGIAVYGNKGSTDQHAYVQQLRDGLHDFFVTFVQVLEDRQGPPMETDAASGDYLHGFLLGTRQALYENGRDSLTITMDTVSAHRLGALIALFERAVGLYAELIDVNAYHQPGVEAGKKAAAQILTVQELVIKHLTRSSAAQTAGEIAEAIAAADETETVYKILEHLAANSHYSVECEAGAAPSADQYLLKTQ